MKSYITIVFYILCIFSVSQLVFGTYIPMEEGYLGMEVFWELNNFLLILTAIPLIYLPFFGRRLFSVEELPSIIPKNLVYHFMGFGPGILILSLTISSIDLYKIPYLIYLQESGAFSSLGERESFEYLCDGALAILSIIILGLSRKRLIKVFSLYKNENQNLFQFIDVVFKILVALKFLKVFFDMIGINTDDISDNSSGLDNTPDFNLDTNGDGIADAIGKDFDGDGVIDTISIDTDGDGIVDTIQYDSDGDGFMDEEIIDMDGDGKFGSLDDELERDYIKKMKK